MSDLNALETPYDGHVFRSRREARWAVFFNTADIPWQYEEQGYDLGKAGWYLPDFLINAGTPAELFFEVKGKLPTREEMAKGEALAQQSKLPVYIYYEQVRLPAPESLAQMDRETYFEDMEQQVERSWAREWLTNPRPDLPNPILRYIWSDDYRPTAVRPFTRKGVAYSQALPLWWTDCPHCGLVVPKLHGQVGCCPSADEACDVTYPMFRHATKRLCDAYEAARSARFESKGKAA